MLKNGFSVMKNKMVKEKLFLENPHVKENKKKVLCGFSQKSFSFFFIFRARTFLTKGDTFF